MQHDGHTYSTRDFKVGEAAYNIGKDKKQCPQVGCTVFRYTKPTRCVVDKLGGAVATYFGDEIDTFSENPEECNKVDAICFSGGSSHGLTTAAGVAETLCKENIQNQRLNESGFFEIPIVKGAITFSGAWGKVQDWKAPDSTLGKLAMRNATGRTVHFGQYGAGSNSEVGSILTGGAWGAEAGQGAYCTKNSKGVYCAVYCNVNAKGGILGEDGDVLYGPKDEDGTNAGGNMFRSTNFLVHTNAKCKSIDLLRQVARQVHVSAAKVISPYASHSDGDVLFLTTSEEIEADDPTELGSFLSDCLWKAVYAMVRHYKNNKKRLKM